MANRRFEMYEIRQVIQRLRLGDTDRGIARTQRVGRRTVAHIRALATEQNWLDAASPIPDDGLIAAQWKTAANKEDTGGGARIGQNLSTVEPYREEVLAWHQQGIAISTMRQALVRKHGYTGSVHALHRFIRRAAPATPAATVMLNFAVGEMAQVDFGSGPVITDRQTGEAFKTWFFVMTLAWSRHQYAEVVRDQSVATWLACHRHAFEWFNGVPRKVRIDNPKCAITKACYYEPTVQRAYGELALGYGFVIDPCPVADPAKKGRVEAGVKYIKGNFAPLREFHGVPHANEQLLAWILGEAGNRIHGSTREPRNDRYYRRCPPSRRPALPGPRPSCIPTAMSSMTTAPTRRRFA
jgi:transposase